MILIDYLCDIINLYTKTSFDCSYYFQLFKIFIQYVPFYFLLCVCRVGVLVMRLQNEEGGGCSVYLHCLFW